MRGVTALGVYTILHIINGRNRKQKARARARGKIRPFRGVLIHVHIESILDKLEVVIALFRDADAFLNVWIRPAFRTKSLR